MTVEADPLPVNDLPDAVRRYFAFALPADQRMLRRVRIEHIGEMALRPERWKPFRSVQTIIAGTPGFAWDARLRLTPWPLWVTVRDSYEDGVGSSRASIARFLPLGRQQGTPEIAASALWRYLAEAVWLPTILLPSEHLTWTALTDKSARAILRDRAVSATADFYFSAEGAVERITGNRYRAVGSGQVLTPTEGRHGAYTRICGMMIPTEGEVTWLLAKGPHTYWRAHIRSATYG